MLVVVLLVVGLLAPPLAAAAAPGSDTRPDPGHPWFGPALDIHSDTPSAYADRLGEDASLYTFPVDYPLTTAGTDQLQRFADELAQQGAVLVLQVEPTVDLQQLTPDDADRLGSLVAGLSDRLGTRTLVRFAPEMNSSWRPWGQQPDGFVAAFRRVAAAVHAAEPTAAMVWSPDYGSGYPFRRGNGADSEIDLSGRREVAPLDTDHNGRLDAGDDPYGPYYPGDDAVDWVGLFLYRFGQSQGVERNVLPPPGELAERLAERWGYPGNGRSSFYERFSAGRNEPLLLETGALHNPTVGGASNLAVKRRWWREVLAALPEHPWIGAVSWLDLERTEPEVADQPVDWRVSAPPAVADALRRDLARSPVDLGPVTRVVASADASTERSTRPPEEALQVPVSGASAGPTAARVAAALLAVALLAGWAGSRRAAWSYRERAARDLRVDLLRGALLLGVLALHLPVGGPLHRAAAGAVSVGGLETFVLVSGLCVGLVHGPLVARVGHVTAAGRRLRRALLTWIATIGTVLGVHVLGLVPALDRSVVGVVHARGGDIDLYAGAQHLVDYPPPGWVARELLAGQLGAWLLLPIALFVVLQALSPVAADPVVRGLWWIVLPVSWAVYAVGRWTGADLLPSYSEVIAPVLVWQLLFVHGIALGHHRRRVATALRSVPGRAALAVAVAASAALLWTGHAPTGSTADLPLGRLLVVATAAAVALVLSTTCWRPLAAGTGAVLLPVGSRPLLTILAQALLVLLVTAVPDRGDPWVGTALTVGCAAVLVLLARWRVGSPEPAVSTATG